MSFSATHAQSTPAVDAVVIPFGTDRRQPRGVPKLSPSDLHFLSARSFTGKAGETAVLPGATAKSPYTVAVGVGDLDDVDATALRAASAASIRAAAGAARVATYLAHAAPTKVRDQAIAAVVDGAGMASYAYLDYRNDATEPALAKLTVITDHPDARSIVRLRRATRLVEAQRLARDLVNGPPDEVSPTYLSTLARKIGRANGLKVTVWGPTQLEANNMGGILGVAAGSDEPPQYVEMVYTPKGRTKTGRIALVGKGITSDSGGLSLKSGDGMMSMKMDMAGAAAVIATMSVIDELAPACEVIGIFCATENLPGPVATMPGDVLIARNGTTIEVLNTDAEGRLVLADGLSRAVELKADAIVDVATLTGACIVSLGMEFAGLMSNDDTFREQVQKAGTRAGENLWPLPLPASYKSHIESSVADIKNIGRPGQAGTLSAGLFLQEFVAGTPWAHLDIAGPAWTDSDNGYFTRGGTGFGVRTLAELLTTFVAPKERSR